VVGFFGEESAEEVGHEKQKCRDYPVGNLNRIGLLWLCKYSPNQYPDRILGKIQYQCNPASARLPSMPGTGRIKMHGSQRLQMGTFSQVIAGSIDSTGQERRGVQKKELTLRGMVKAIAVYLMVQLEGAMSPKLIRGYGPVNPGLRECLNPKLKEMISILEKMESGI
jgi:hypothetical protein